MAEAPRDPSATTFSRTRTVAVTACVIAAAIAAVTGGAAQLAERADAVAPPEGAGALPVAVRALEVADGFETRRRFLGRIEAAQESALAFEFAGRVVAVMADEGDEVAEGDAVARLDTALLETDLSRLEAARAALAADLEFAKLNEERQAELLARGHTTQEAEDRARLNRAALAARLTETEAQIDSVRVRLEKSVLKAPFAGRVAARQADIGATVAPGEPVVTLMQTDARQLRVGLPLWADATPGSVWDVAAGGLRGTARLIAVRPDIDPATRTRTALFALDGIDAPFGAAATVTVPRRVAARGAWVPVDALREGAPGVWTVLVLGDDGVVQPAPVEILHAEADRVFVSGPLRDGLSVISAGAHRVTPGQRVAKAGGDG